MILELLFMSSTVALILLVWFNTEAFIEYTKLFSGTRFFLVDDFREKQKEYVYPAPHLDYISYLVQYHDSFFIRLITCPLCLSFWLTVALCLITGEWLLLPMTNLLGLIFFKVTTKVINW